MEARSVKLAIVGSRDFTDWQRFVAALEPYLRLRYSSRSEDLKWWIEEVVSGGARGADSMAKQWAIVNDLKMKVFEAQWQRPDGTTDKGAGFARNTDIAEYADVCIAFWDMQSRGTADTINKFRKLKKRVVIIPVGDHPCGSK